MKRELSEDEAGGMTVNERLFLSGQMDDFDMAVARRDVPELERILRSVYLSPENIRAIIKHVLSSSNGTV
ncbi:MAG: hypothetical protein M3362_23475 [Acidobacteriota bacterium]|nr:hypothetical protein [Acidobacteriota bacterium]